MAAKQAQPAANQSRPLKHLKGIKMKPLYVVAVDALATAYENGDDPQKDYADYYAQKKEAPTYAAMIYPGGIKAFELWIFSVYK